MSASALARPATSLRTAAAHWIEAPAFDLVFFTLAPLVTLPIILAYSMGSRLALVAGFLLAYPHYLSTFTFYLWDENRPRHRERWVAFIAGPAVLAITFVLLVVFRVPLVIQVALFAWNTYHVARQSAGILSIYRHRAGVSDAAERDVANAAILATNGWFCLWNIGTHREVFPVLSWVAPWFPQALWGALGAVAVFALLRLARTLVARARAGRPPAAPEIGFIVASLVLFHPYLWIPDSAAATFAMLIPHYLQYLGLVWLLHRRKFPRPEGSALQVGLQRLSASVPALVVTLAGIGFFFLAANVLFTRFGVKPVYEAFYLLLAFTHFYLDGLFWAFKDPHVRRSLGPSLTRGGPAAEAARVAEALGS